jgi:hypothetical protein
VQSLFTLLHSTLISLEVLIIHVLFSILSDYGRIQKTFRLPLCPSDFHLRQHSGAHFSFSLSGGVSIQAFVFQAKISCSSKELVGWVWRTHNDLICVPLVGGMCLARCFPVALLARSRFVMAVTIYPGYTNSSLDG